MRRDQHRPPVLDVMLCAFDTEEEMQSPGIFTLFWFPTPAAGGGGSFASLPGGERPINKGPLGAAEALV